MCSVAAMTNALRIYVDFGMPDDALELLRAGTMGHDLVFPKQLTASVLAGAAPDPEFATADIAFGQPDPGAVADAARLKWIQISTSGITRYDTSEFRALVAGRGIPVCNAARVYAEACAVHAMSFILAHTRSLPRALASREDSSAPAWKELRASGTTLQGATVLIVGFGTIGRRLTELLRPFGANVIAHRRKPRGDEGVPVVTDAELADVLATKADHVVNILPDSPTTRGFFDEARFAAMKAGAVFHNIGRGSSVDQDALLRALQSGRLAAAWLDVTEPEPLPDGHPLLALPNCHITPHIAGGHRGESVTLVRQFLDNFGRFQRGEPLIDRVM
jgi:phosphoglycerate dehydrogenase-like enzyme